MKSYVLDENKQAIETEDPLAWARQRDADPTGEKTGWRVAETFIGDVRINTVFLGLDHSFGLGGPPLLFETMIFGGSLDEEQERYSTREEALAGHNRWVLLAEAAQGIDLGR